MLIARASHSATLLANGTVLVSGGYSQNFDGDAQPYRQTMFTAELFNPATLVSMSAASLIVDRAEHGATTLNDGQILITGGVSGFQCCDLKSHFVTLSSAEVYK
ncbi:MAG: hypothetical protein DMG90_10385 [Acidobacteria bacterium]|nr:MAG: hypothetical protein DMG90_10385 [Acidobacteriota bacterium]